MTVRARPEPWQTALQMLDWAPALAAAGRERQTRETQVEMLRAANEVSDGFLVHSPYVLYTRVAAG